MLASKYLGPVLFSIDELASAIEIEKERLFSISANADNHYFPERQEWNKRKKKSRLINEPFEELKDIQRRMIKVFFNAVQFPDYLSGGIKGRNHLNSSRQHTKSIIVLTDDIHNFFASVQISLVQRVWQEFFGFPEQVATILTKLTTVRGFLPQGARTSTYIADLIFFDSEPQLVATLRKRNLIYTRHVDDMNVSSRRLLSSETINFVRSRTCDMLNEKGFDISAKKRQKQDLTKPCRVHGLLTNAGRLTKGKKEISKIRVAIKQLSDALRSETANLSAVETMFDKALGRVSELQQYQPEKAKTFRIDLNAVRTVATQKWPDFLKHRKPFKR